MKRRKAEGKKPEPEYVCTECGVKTVRLASPVRIGRNKMYYCRVCRSSTEHMRIG